MIRLLVIAIFVLTSFFSSSLTASAHDLLPKQIVIYLHDHPNATPEEIQAFALQEGGEMADKFKDKDEIIRIVRNQQTSVLDNAFDFLKLGVGHILSGPDHILFVLSLLLVFISMSEILKLTGTFTIAHSITLILSALGLITVSTRVSEPLIAFSIAFVAISTVFFRNSRFVGGEKSKLATVFFFGLFHGMGFAGLLREIAIPSDKFVSSLFAFNIGIEVGQLIIIGVALPFIFLFRKKPWYPKVIQVFAVIISLLALFWVVQRIFFL